MNLDEMQSAWDSPRNIPSKEEQQQLARQFARKMIRRRRFQSVWLINTFVWLTVITAVAVRSIVIGKTEPAQDWGLFPLLIAPWALALHFLRRHLKPAASLAGGELSVADSFRASLGSNRTESTHLKMVGGLLVLTVPLLAWSMHQLYAVDKVSGHEFACMAAFFGAALLLGGGGIAIRYFGRLLPEQKQLDALLRELAHQPR